MVELDSPLLGECDIGCLKPAVAAYWDARRLGIVDFVVLPHYDSQVSRPHYDTVIEQYEDRYEIIPLRYDQAVWVEGDHHEVIPS
jgi:hypothetical protein